MIGHQGFPYQTFQQQYQFPQIPQIPQIQQIPQVQQSQGTQQIQNGGFIVVHTEDEALRYPVAPGNSVTFKIENMPIVIEKTAGFSQLESPRIERFRLVKEEAVEPQKKDADIRYALAADVEKLRSEVEALQAKIAREGADE